MRNFLNLTIIICTLWSTNVFADHYPKPTQRMVPLLLDCRSPGMVALTFDDGPSENFETVLGTLKNHDVKATFFLLGKKLADQNNINKALAAIKDGHQIENHSWDHKDFLKLSDSEIHTQVDDTNLILWESLGVTPRFFRPPHGRIDVPSAMPVWDLGYGVALWNLDPQDYKSSWSWGPQQVFNEIEDALQSASPTENSFVILLHDASPTSIEKLDDIILTIKSHGYSLVTLDECADSGAH
mgnify:CR=1 FL=1